MVISKTEIRALIDEIEERKGTKFLSPKAFDGLSVDIFNKTKSQISTSTLKRIWGYINSPDKVRISTLDILSKYIDYKDFIDFRERKLYANTSGYLTEKVLLANHLKEGNLVEIGWLPDRYCKLQYKGNGVFSIIEALNTALPCDKTFRIHSFMMNKPLHLEIIEDTPDNEKIYIAGKKTGLNLINLLNGR